MISLSASPLLLRMPGLLGDEDELAGTSLARLSCWRETDGMATLCASAEDPGEDEVREDNSEAERGVWPGRDRNAAAAAETVAL